MEGFIRFPSPAVKNNQWLSPILPAGGGANPHLTGLRRHLQLDARLFYRIYAAPHRLWTVGLLQVRSIGTIAGVVPRRSNRRYELALRVPSLPSCLPLSRPLGPRSPRQFLGSRDPGVARRNLVGNGDTSQYFLRYELRVTSRHFSAPN